MLQETRTSALRRYALPVFAVAIGCAPVDPTGVPNGSSYPRSAAALVNGSSGGAGGSIAYATAGAAGVQGDSTVPTHPVSFEFGVPGTSAPVEASSPSQLSTGIDVLAYPESLDLLVQHGLLPVGFEAAFTADYCANIQRLARLGKTSAAVRAQVYRMLREQGSVIARLRISTLVGADFTQRAVSAARAAGNASAAHINNPIKIDSATVALELAEDAVSNLLGATEDITHQVNNALEQQGEAALIAGFFSAAIGAKDLWCDLASGKAILRLNISGEVGSQSYYGQTRLTRVESL